MSDWMQYATSIAAFVGVTATFLALVLYLGRRRRFILDRMDELSGETQIDTSDVRTSDGGLAGAIRWLAAKLMPRDEAKRARLKDRIMHAGLYHPMALPVYLVVRLMQGIGPILAVTILWFMDVLTLPEMLFFGAVSSAIGTMIPSFWLDRRKAKRHIVLTRSLPDFLDLLVTCLESGLSLDAALRRVTQELRFAHAILSVEMDRVQQEIDLGATADAALQNFAHRTDMDSIRTLGTFLRQARQFGTSIADALRSHAEMLRTQREQRAEELAQKAAVKVLIPTLLLIFPAVFVVLAGPAVIQIQDKFMKATQ